MCHYIIPLQTLLPHWSLTVLGHIVYVDCGNGMTLSPLLHCASCAPPLCLRVVDGDVVSSLTAIPSS